VPKVLIPGLVRIPISTTCAAVILECELQPACGITDTQRTRSSVKEAKELGKNDAPGVSEGMSAGLSLILTQDCRMRTCAKYFLMLHAAEASSHFDADTSSHTFSNQRPPSHIDKEERETPRERGHTSAADAGACTSGPESRTGGSPSSVAGSDRSGCARERSKTPASVGFMLIATHASQTHSCAHVHGHVSSSIHLWAGSCAGAHTCVRAYQR
jgi:hypothetical protein